jgi:hypothetical protein
MTEALTRPQDMARLRFESTVKIVDAGSALQLETLKPEY